MTEQRKGAVATMAVLAVLLVGFGVWQFGSLDLGEAKKHDSKNEHEYEEHHHTRDDKNALPLIDTSILLNRIAAEQNGRIIKLERERKRGRDLYEIKLIGPDGRVYELKVDARSGEVIDRD